MSNFNIKYIYQMVDRASRPMKIIGKSAQDSSRNVRRLADRARKATGGLNRMGGAASNSANRLRRLGNEADFADRRLHRLARRMRNLQTIRLGMGGTLTGLGAGLLTRRVGSSLVDYEGAMNLALSKMVEGEGPGGFILKGFEPASKSAKDIQASVKASNAAIRLLRTETMKIARVSKFTPTEVADGLTELASAGIDATTALGMLHPVMRLAGATGVDAGLAADFVTNVSNQFGVALSELPNTVDMMATAINATNFKMQDLAASMKYAGASSFAAGQDITRITAALMALAQVGEKGSSAGNALSRIFESLYKSSGPATKALKSIGLTQDSFLNKEGKAIPLVEIMEKLNGASHKFGYKKVQRVIQALFQARGGRGAKILMRVLKEIDRFEDQLVRKSRNRARLMEKVMMSGVYGAYQEMRSSLYEAVIALGDGGLSKDLESLADWIKGLANSFSQLNPETQKWVGRALLLVTAISAVIIPLGVFMWALGALLPILTLVGGALALLISPIGLVVAGLAALATWLMHKYDISFDDMIQGAKAFGDALMHPLETLKKIASIIGTSIRDKVRSMVPESWLLPDGYKHPENFSESATGKATQRMWNDFKGLFGGQNVTPPTGKSLARSEVDKQTALNVRTETKVDVSVPPSITLKGVDGRVHGSIPLTTSSDKGRTQVDSAAIATP